MEARNEDHASAISGKEKDNQTLVSYSYNANCFSKTFYFYLSHHFALARQRAAQSKSLTAEDIIKIDPEYNASAISDKFLEGFRKTKSMVKALIFSVWGNSFFLAMLFVLLNTALIFAGPVFLKLILTFYADSSKPEYEGYIYSAALSVANLFRSIFAAHAVDYSNFIITLSSSALYGAIYKTVLKMGPAAIKEITTGQIMNLVTTDANLISDLINQIHFLWSQPLIVIVAIIMICLEMTWCGLVGLCVICGLSCFQLIMMSAAMSNMFATLGLGDKRSKIIHELLQGIRLIKSYAWEKFARDKIGEVRKSEIVSISKGRMLVRYAKLYIAWAKHKSIL